LKNLEIYNERNINWYCMAVVSSCCRMLY